MSSRDKLKRSVEKLSNEYMEKALSFTYFFISIFAEIIDVSSKSFITSSKVSIGNGELLRICTLSPLSQVKVISIVSLGGIILKSVSYLSAIGI